MVEVVSPVCPFQFFIIDENGGYILHAQPTVINNYEYVGPQIEHNKGVFYKKNEATDRSGNHLASGGNQSIYSNPSLISSRFVTSL